MYTVQSFFSCLELFRSLSLSLSGRPQLIVIARETEVTRLKNQKGPDRVSCFLYCPGIKRYKRSERIFAGAKLAHLGAESSSCPVHTTLCISHNLEKERKRERARVSRLSACYKDASTYKVLLQRIRKKVKWCTLTFRAYELISIYYIYVHTCKPLELADFRLVVLWKFRGASRIQDGHDKTTTTDDEENYISPKNVIVVMFNSCYENPANKTSTREIKRQRERGVARVGSNGNVRTLSKIWRNIVLSAIGKYSVCVGVCNTNIFQVCGGKLERLTLRESR